MSTTTETTTVIDNEGDVWVENPETGLYYLPLAPWDETPEDAESTLEEIAAEYGIAGGSTPRYSRGDVTVNILSGREALILRSHYKESHGQHVYTIIEKGYLYPPGCSRVKNAGTFPEQFLAPTDQPRFSEAEVAVLTLVYTL